jgi:hypothetical protein
VDGVESPRRITASKEPRAYLEFEPSLVRLRYVEKLNDILPDTNVNHYMRPGRDGRRFRSFASSLLRCLTTRFERVAAPYYSHRGYALLTGVWSRSAGTSILAARSCDVESISAIRLSTSSVVSLLPFAKEAELVAAAGDEDSRVHQPRRGRRNASNTQSALARRRRSRGFSFGPFSVRLRGWLVPVHDTLGQKLRLVEPNRVLLVPRDGIKQG